MSPTKIKALRKKLEISQEMFAHRIGVSFQSVNRWERGLSKPSRLALEKIKSLEESIDGDKLSPIYKLEKKHERM